MPNYLYFCEHCQESFEVQKPMDQATEIEYCQRCGREAERKWTPIPDSFGWRLTETSHIRGNPDEYERAI